MAAARSGLANQHFGLSWLCRLRRSRINVGRAKICETASSFRLASMNGPFQPLRSQKRLKIIVEGLPRDREFSTRRGRQTEFNSRRPSLSIEKRP